MGIVQTGYLEFDELKSCQQLPSCERYAKGPVAIIECVQEIPCNPCEAACKFGAIMIGDEITKLPTLNADKCTGCGMCIAKCPGLAIFVVDKSGGDSASVAFPYEYFPIPLAGDKVTAVNRKGEPVCDGIIVKVVNPKAYDHTPVITVKIPVEFADEVRSIQRRRQ